MFRDARYLIKPEEGQAGPAVMINALAATHAIAPRTDGRIKRLDE